MENLISFVDLNGPPFSIMLHPSSSARPTCSSLSLGNHWCALDAPGPSAHCTGSLGLLDIIATAIAAQVPAVPHLDRTGPLAAVWKTSALCCLH